MKTFEINIEDWYLQCLPDDGGRISILRYRGEDLLTAFPSSFRPPRKYLGEYETRPVYGYDDCFPTVDLCRYPGQSGMGHDHGELFRQKWNISRQGNSLICIADCPNPRAIFTRCLEFSGNGLKWKFNIINKSPAALAFLHVMHALIPLQNIQNVKFPACDCILDEIAALKSDFKTPEELRTCLMDIKPGNFRMLLIRDPVKGIINFGFKTGLNVTITYSPVLFPTLGIWWNNAGYPDEDGLRRIECAFEPIPGSCSSLEQSYEDGIYLKAEPEIPLNWEICWEVNNSW